MSDQILESTQGNIKELTIVSSTGKKIDISGMCQDLILIEDIFYPCLHGEMHIKDTQNLLVALDIHGNEYVHMILETPTVDPIDRYFRVYSVSDLRMQTATSVTYTIHFCSEESVLNQQMLISKSYKYVRNSEIVSDVLKNKLKVSDKKIVNIETTNSQENIVVPNMKPFELINWISSFSLNSTLGSAFVFYESSKGFNFTSLETLFAQQPFKTISISSKNVQNDGDKSIDNRFVVDKFEVLNAFDIQETISTGGYSSSMVKIQLETYTYENLKFNIINNKYQKLNKELPINNGKNRLDKTLVSDSAYIRCFPTFQGNLIDKWLLQRASQFSLLNSFRIRVQLSGDSSMPVGSIIRLDFPSIVPIENASDAQKDLYKSGNYLVTRIKHRFFENKYFGYLEMSRDSLYTAIPAAVASSPTYDVAKKS